MKGIIIIITLLSSHLILAQADSSQLSKPTQYRRGTELQAGYQTYEQKYQGKDLNEEKRRLFPLEGTGVWTELNPKVPRVDYLGIHFVNTNTGWACGDLGTVIKSTDGGESWITEETNTTTPVLKVNSLDGQMVIASGFDGMILRSTDGGDSWTQITSGVTGDLWGLQMINDTLGWSCGTGNSLIKTTDRGLSWQIVTTPGYTGNNWWIDFLNESYGFIAGDGKVLRTTDGGNNWDVIQADDSYPLYTIDVIDSLHIAAAGYGGLGYTAKNIYSSDGGNTWINGEQLTTHEINCIKYINPDTGYITMSEIGMYRTTNRGGEWTDIESIRDIGEFEFQLYATANIGFSAGTGLKISKTEDSLENWHKVIINDDFADTFFPTEQKGFVISSGPWGRVYRTFDSGEHWQFASGPSGYSLLFTDSLTGYLGSTSVWKTTNGGDSWYQTNSPNTYGEIKKIFFINNNIGWYVASGGVIYKTTDSGENWFQQLYRSGAGFTSISFVDSLYGWASLGGWRPYKTTDGGLNWIEQTNQDFWNTNDVYFTNIDTGFIINGFIGNNLYKTFDGGLNWFPDPIIDAAYNFNPFPNKFHWILNGVHQRWETTNNGYTWYEITQDIPGGFNNFQAPKDWLGYGAGGTGLILKYVDTSYVPVELSSFEYKIEDNKITLTWITASELNNRGFYIEKSYDKINWESNEFVNGNGTTTQTHSYSYTDKNGQPGKYYYRLKQIDFDGSFEYSKEVEVDVSAPTEFALDQNYPNPFNPETNISFTIAEEANVSLKLYDITGREIRALVNEKKQPGYYKIKLKGGELSSGVYFYRLESSSGYSATKKLILLK